MTVAAKDDGLRCLADKSLDGQLLWELQNGFELSPRESQGIYYYLTQGLQYRRERWSLDANMSFS